MNILITGAAGFIGSHMAELLNSKGYNVTGLDNFSTYYDVDLKYRNARDLELKGIEVLRKDLCNIEDYTSLPTNFDFIIHFAAQPGISAQIEFEDYLQNNFIATQNLLQFALENKSLKHFFNISTSSIYGLDATFPETTAPAPASHYGVTKLAAEQLVLAESRSGRLSASSLRLYSVYGPRERPEKLYTKLISCAFNNEAFSLFEGSEHHLRSFTYVGDIVKGILAAVEKHKELNGEIINLGTEENHTTREGIAIVEELLGVKIALKVVPKRAGDQLRTAAKIEKAKKILGYQASTTLKQGLEQQIEWYRKEFL